MMGTPINKKFAVRENVRYFRNEKTVVGRHWCRSEHPLLAQPTPCEKLKMMCARNVVMPRAQNLCSLVQILLCQGRRKPAVSQRVPGSEAFGQVIKRYDVSESLVQERLLDRDIGRRYEAHSQSQFGFSVGRHLAWMKERDTAPGGGRCEVPRVAIDHHLNLAADVFEDLARKAAHVSRAIEGKWRIVGHG